MSSSVTKRGVFIAQKLNYSLPKFPFYPLTAGILEYSLGRPVMLQLPTQISGITAVHSVQNSDSGAASLRVSSRPRVFAASYEGAIGIASPFAPSARAPSLRCGNCLFAPLRATLGNSGLRLVGFVPNPLGSHSSPPWHTSLLVRFLARSRTPSTTGFAVGRRWRPQQ